MISFRIYYERIVELFFPLPAHSNPSGKVGQEPALPKPVPNGIARLNQATGRRGAGQTLQNGPSLRSRRVVKKPLRNQQTSAHIPAQEDARGSGRNQVDSSSKGEPRAARADQSLRARALQALLADRRAEQAQQAKQARQPDGKSLSSLHHSWDSSVTLSSRQSGAARYGPREESRQEWSRSWASPFG